MPTYEYQCENCHKQFEIFQSISDPAKTTCEECGGKLNKLLSAGSGLIFKGSGFYITDYKDKSGSGTKESKPTTTPPAGGCSGGSCTPTKKD